MSHRQAMSVQTYNLSSGRFTERQGDSFASHRRGKTQLLKGVWACLLITYYSSHLHLHSLTLWALWSYQLTDRARLWNVGGHQVEDRLKKKKSTGRKTQNLLAVIATMPVCLNLKFPATGSSVTLPCREIFQCKATRLQNKCGVSQTSQRVKRHQKASCQLHLK